MCHLHAKVTVEIDETKSNVIMITHEEIAWSCPEVVRVSSSHISHHAGTVRSIWILVIRWTSHKELSDINYRK